MTGYKYPIWLTVQLIRVWVNKTGLDISPEIRYSYLCIPRSCCSLLCHHPQTWSSWNWLSAKPHWGIFWDTHLASIYLPAVLEPFTSSRGHHPLLFTHTHWGISMSPRAINVLSTTETNWRMPSGSLWKWGALLLHEKTNVGWLWEGSPPLWNRFIFSLKITVNPHV